MFRQISLIATIVAALILFDTAHAQITTWHASEQLEKRPLFTVHFEGSDFEDRRESVLDSIGSASVAVLQGAPSPMGFLPIRQSSEFYYLTGIESPHAYLILNGFTGESTLYLASRDERREYNEGKVISVEDSLLVKEWGGFEHVRRLTELPADLKSINDHQEITTMYTHMSPYEHTALTRSMAYRSLADRDQDPLDNRPGRFELFMEELEALAPNLEMKNLDLIVDEMRRIKNDTEIDLITASTRLQGEAILEAMRSSEVGVKAYELEAVAKYIYHKHDIQDDAYYPLIHIGPDAFMNHYHNSVRPAKNGDMILMDYGAYYNYYSSDMARMWPANGTFNPIQRELYSFYLIFYENILYTIDLGLTPQQIIKTALEKTGTDLEGFTFTEPAHEEAARMFLDSYRRSANNPLMRMGHGVGMAVHDVGNYTVPLEPGMVFVIEPQFRVEEEHIYLRLEDMIVMTEEGAEIISDFVPRDIERIEEIMAEEGMLQQFNLLFLKD